MTEEQLQLLIHKYTEGIASREELHQLMHWYRSHSIMEVHWPSDNQEEKVIVRERMLRRLREAIPRHQPQTTKRLFSIPRVRMAAAVLVLALGTAVVYYFGRPTTSFYSVSNPFGQIKMVVLPDSSRVWLNASSTLMYDKAFGKSRNLKLDGEAFFQVTRDASRPFSVEAGGVQTIVLGTSFNIDAYKADRIATVAVITGKVGVKSSAGNISLLNPSNQLRFDNQTRLTSISVIDTNQILAWRKGELRFQGETLEQIAASLERWYGVAIAFSNQGLGKCRYYMSFNNTISLDKLLPVMTETTGLEYKLDQKNKIVRVSGRECQP